MFCLRLSLEWRALLLRGRCVSFQKKRQRAAERWAGGQTIKLHSPLQESTQGYCRLGFTQSKRGAITQPHNAWFTINNVIKAAMRQPERRLAGGKKRSPWRCVRESGLNTVGDVIITFFIHYFHNDCYYVQPLIEFLFFFFASQARVQKNNYHLSDGEMKTKHFHGQSVCKKWVIVREYFGYSCYFWTFWISNCLCCLLLHDCSVVGRFGHQLHLACTENKTQASTSI